MEVLTLGIAHRRAAKDSYIVTASTTATTKAIVDLLVRHLFQTLGTSKTIYSQPNAVVFRYHRRHII